MPDDNDITAYLYEVIDNWKCQHIVIDEGQDFHEEHLDLLFAIKECRGSFYVFYDEKQLVQRQKIQECL